MRLVASLKKRIARLDPRPRVCRRLGAIWLLDPTDWLDLRLIARVEFETAQLNRFQALVGAFRPTRFLDCGANFGLYSVLMAKAYPDLVIDAFEPVDSTRWKLVSNLGLNGLIDQVSVHAVALSNAPGSAEIDIDPRSSGVATLSATAGDRAKRDFARRQTVALVRLDDHLRLAGERLALKIDVEGHELSVLAGMERTIRDNACVVQIETRDHTRAAVQTWFIDHGYHSLGMIAEDAYFAAEPINAA
jgi:FkbM family methyltransferase